MQAWKIIVPVTQSIPRPRAREGFEWLYVLSGRMRLVLGQQGPVAAGDAIVSPSLLAPCGPTSSAAKPPIGTNGPRSSSPRPPDREREVGTAVGAGASTAGIAASLHMSEATVKAHVSRLLSKLNVTNRVQIAILVRDATNA